MCTVFSYTESYPTFWPTHLIFNRLTICFRKRYRSTSMTRETGLRDFNSGTKKSVNFRLCNVSRYDHVLNRRGSAANLKWLLRSIVLFASVTLLNYWKFKLMILHSTFCSSLEIQVCVCFWDIDSSSVNLHLGGDGW